MPAHSLHTRGATLIATTCCFALSSRRRDGGWDVTTFSRFFRCMGTTHPCLLTSASCPAEIFFGWPLTKAFGEGRSIPNFHSVSDRCRRPHPVLCSLNAGQSAVILCFKDTSRPAKSQFLIFQRSFLKGVRVGPSKARIQSPGNNPLYFTCYNGCVTSERIVSLL